MKKSVNKIVLCIAVIGALLLCSVGTVFALWVSEGETVNKINMNSYVEGKIIEEYEEAVVYPGADVTKIVQVKNTGNIDALPRVKIEKAWGVKGEDGKLIPDDTLNPDYIIIEYNTVDWIGKREADGYYFYYNHVLEPKEITKPLFNGFTVSEKADGSYKNKYANIVVNMEIIQAGGGGLSYWNAEEIGVEHYVENKQKPIKTTVEFLNPTDGFAFAINGGDLFSNFKNLIPGCTRSQIIEVTNKWNQEVELSLRADFIEQAHATAATRELINDLLHEYATIVITDENKTVIYDGPVWGSPDKDSTGTDSMKYPHSLGSFSGKESKNLNVSLSLSPDMNNEHMELLGLIKWIFRAEGVDVSDQNSSTTVPTPPPVTGSVVTSATTAAETTTIETTTVETTEETTTTVETTEETTTTVETTEETTTTAETTTAPIITAPPTTRPANTGTTPPTTAAPVTAQTTTDPNYFGLDSDGLPRGDMNVPNESDPDYFGLDSDGLPRGDMNAPTGSAIGGSAVFGTLIFSAVALIAGKRRRK